MSDDAPVPQPVPATMPPPPRRHARRELPPLTGREDRAPILVGRGRVLVARGQGRDGASPVVEVAIEDARGRRAAVRLGVGALHVLVRTLSEEERAIDAAAAATATPQSPAAHGRRPAFDDAPRRPGQPPQSWLDAQGRSGGAR
jgi:hypothetical protein